MSEDRKISARGVAVALLGGVLLVCTPLHLGAAQAQLATGPGAGKGTIDLPQRLQPLVKRLSELPKEEAFEEFIRGAYVDLVRWTGPSGKDLSFELRSFVHIPRDAFDTVKFSDVVTYPGGDTVVVARGRHRGTWTDEVRVMYDPGWVVRKNSLVTERGRKEAMMRLDEVLELASTGNERLRELTSITSYEVTVSLEGKTRTYLAAFAWIDREPRSSGLSSFDAIVFDNVTGRVLETLRETEPLGNRDSLPAPQATGTDGEDHSGPVLAPKTTCMAGSGVWSGNESGRDFWQADTTGHINGAHQPFMRFKADCECTSTCGQTCTPTLSFQACQEAGEIESGCHDLSSPSWDVVSGTKSDTLIQGAADCGGGVACTWRACFVCGGCGPVTVTLEASRSGVGGSISYEIPAAEGAVMKVKHDHLCDTCPADSEDDGQDGARDEPTEPNYDGDCRCTPIVIHLGRGSVQLSGLDDPVRFDMDGDGSLEVLSWTGRQSDTAFLVYDRNGDGAISQGYELFGNFTPQPSPDGEPWNGFRALAAFDLEWLGGNEDGWITAEDQYFDELLLWFDDDHDGVSQEHELFTLEDYAIEAIELGYVDHWRRDRHGNELRFSSRVRFEGGRTTRAVDVFFLTGSP